MQNFARYSSVAIALHWIIALLIIGLLAVGKWMTSLPETDPLRFEATQWHKSFGILVLALSVLRVLWRLGHRPPALPAGMKGWEKFASGATHFAFYLLMLGVPLSGWLMVSASPLNLSTALFNVLPVPHLPTEFIGVEKAVLAEQMLELHFWLSSAMMALAILHVLAALRHQFILKDNLIARMIIGAGHRVRGDTGHGVVLGLLLATAGLFGLAGLGAFKTASLPAVPTGAADVAVDNQAEVAFTATQVGEPLPGRFASATIELILLDDLAQSKLTARVETASVESSDTQVAITLPTADWFNSAQFPEAVFQSSQLSRTSADELLVDGDLTLKGVTAPISFALSIDNGQASGSFDIDRTRFGVGGSGQDDFAGKTVTISFSFIHR